MIPGKRIVSSRRAIAARRWSPWKKRSCHRATTGAAWSHLRPLALTSMPMVATSPTTAVPTRTTSRAIQMQSRAIVSPAAGPSCAVRCPRRCERLRETARKGFCTDRLPCRAQWTHTQTLTTAGSTSTCLMAWCSPMAGWMRMNLAISSLPTVHTPLTC